MFVAWAAEVVTGGGSLTPLWRHGWPNPGKWHFPTLLCSSHSSLCAVCCQLLNSENTWLEWEGAVISARRCWLTVKLFLEKRRWMWMIMVPAAEEASCHILPELTRTTKCLSRNPEWQVVQSPPSLCCSGGRGSQLLSPLMASGSCMKLVRPTAPELHKDWVLLLLLGCALVKLQWCNRSYFSFTLIKGSVLLCFLKKGLHWICTSYCRTPLICRNSKEESEDREHSTVFHFLSAPPSPQHM